MYNKTCKFHKILTVPYIHIAYIDNMCHFQVYKVHYLFTLF